MHRFARRSLWLSLGVGFVAVWSAIIAYYRIFTGFAEWDDEGMLMMTVRQFLAGGALYDTIRTGYGPAYYFYNWLVRQLTFTAVSHDATRMTSVVVWTLCSMACAWIAWSLGKSLIAALLTQLLVFRTLSFFCNEPGHPQELCLMLLIALAASGLAAESLRLRRIALLLAGAIPAALLLVKINIGIFAVLAVSLAMLYHVPRTPFVTIARYLAGAAALALPFLLMRAHLGDPPELAYCVAVAAGSAALLAAAAGLEPLFSLRDCAIAVAAFVLACAVLLGALLIQGVSPGSIVTSLVLQHIQLSVKGGWYLSVILSRWWILWAILSPVAALLAARSRRPIAASSTPIALGIAALSVAALLLAAFDGSQDTRSSQSLGIMVPFCWILAVPLCDGRPRLAYARTLLAAIATLQALYAFPIAGSQAPFTRVLLIVVAGVSLGDALSALSPRLRQGVLAKGVAAVIFGCILLTYPVQAWRAQRTYRAATLLNLPGARRVRLDAGEAATFQWLARQLNRHCDTFVGYPGIPSLYFWTGLRMPGPASSPPGPLNAGSWTLLFTPAQQQSIVDEFAQHPDGCAIYHPSGVKFWNRTGLDERSLPLVEFLQSNFKTVDVMGDYQFQVRKDRAWAASPNQ